MAAVPAGSLRLWVVSAPDSTIREAILGFEYDPGTDMRRPERGRWTVSLVQDDAGGDEIGVTVPVTIQSPRLGPIRLGRPIGVLKPSFPLFLRVNYAATDGSEAVFWSGMSKVNVTVHLV